jgi:hypothetical protein
VAYERSLKLKIDGRATGGRARVRQVDPESDESAMAPLRAISRANTDADGPEGRHPANCMRCSCALLRARTAGSRQSTSKVVQAAMTRRRLEEFRDDCFRPPQACLNGELSRH